MRAVPLLLEQPLEAGRGARAPSVTTLGGESARLWATRSIGALDAVRGEEPPREDLVDRPVEPERVARHETGDLLAEDVRVAQPPEHAPAITAPSCAWLAPTGRRPACRGRGATPRGARGAASSASAAFCTTANRCSSSGAAAGRCRGRTRSPLVLGQDLRRARRCRARAGGLRGAACRAAASTARPSRRRPARRRSARPRRGASPGASARICVERLSGGARTTAARGAAGRAGCAADPRGSVRGDRAELAPLEVARARRTGRQLAGLEPPRHRVDREVAPRHVVRDRDRRVGDDREVAVARPGAALVARRRQLDSRRRERADRSRSRG